jgi:hypothetical protein
MSTLRGTNPRFTSRVLPSPRSIGVTTSTPARPFCERFTTRNCSSSRYRPETVTLRHSIASGGPLARTSSSGSGGRSLRASTLALKSRRWSRRRSCQKPRLIIATMPTITSRWNPIHFGRNRNRYMRRRR